MGLYLTRKGGAVQFEQSVLLKSLVIGAGAGVVLGLVGSLPFLGFILLGIGPILYLLVGAIYGYFAGQAGHPVNLAAWVAAGVGTGIIAALAASVIRIVPIALVGLVGLGGGSADSEGLLALAGFTGLALCGNLFVNVLFAGIGALIYGLVKQREAINAGQPV